MTTNYVSPKLLFEFYKGEKVPPLVLKSDLDYQSYTSPNRRHPSNNTAISSINNETNMNQVYQFKLAEKQKEVERQVQQNRQLRLIIKELQQKIQKLLVVNGELMQRIEDLQQRTRYLSEAADKNKRDISRKVKVQIYTEVEEFLKISVQKFTNQLSSIKMTAVMESKIQQFLQQILNINNLAVRKTLKPKVDEKSKKLFDQEEVNKTIKQIIQRRSKSKQKQRELDASRYEGIIEKLSHQNSGYRPGMILTRQYGSPGQRQTDSSKRSSNKRPRIFNRTNGDNQHSRSRDNIRKLDF